MKWTTHSATEFFLRKLGIKFSRKTIKFSEINLDVSKGNKARATTAVLIPERIEQYRSDMDAGDAAFPSPVVIQRGNGYVLLDGNQRCHAFAASVHYHANAEISAYVVCCDDEELISLATRYFNRTNGEGQSTEEAVLHAQELKLLFPSMTHAALAQAAGVSRQSIQKAFKVQEVASFLKNAKVRVAELSNQAMLQIATLKNEPTQLAVAKLAANHGLKADRVREIVVDVKDERSEGAQLAKCAKWESDLIKHEPAGKIVRPHATRDRLTRLMRELLAHLKRNPSLAALQLTAKSDADSARALREELRDALEEVFGK